VRQRWSALPLVLLVPASDALDPDDDATGRW